MLIIVKVIMINKILVVDDFDCASLATSQALKEVFTSEIVIAKCFDEAYLKIKRGLFDQVPYELLICNLSFKGQYGDTILNSGEKFIVAIKKIQPNIKIIVFSAENKSFRIKALFDKSNINAFVCKGRNSVPELIKAVQCVFNNNIKNSLFGLSNTLAERSILNIEEYDISLLKLLSLGLTLEEIGFDFRKTKTIPNGYSTIEKHVNKLKIDFGAKNTVHLVAIAKDIGLV